VLILKVFSKRETIRRLHDPHYVSTRPYAFFTDGEMVAKEDKEHAHNIKTNVSMN
jgi:hypothetical protein